MSVAKRLDLALSRLGSGEWQAFEKLASAFLADEWPELRTLAAPSGDEGRDAILYHPAAEPSVVIQYSVRDDWAAKIRSTVTRLEETRPNERSMLVYVTNQDIGAKADGLKKDLRRDNKISLDVFDRSWFVERAASSKTREVASETLSELVVDPLLADAGVMKAKPQALTGTEAQAAWLYLGLQWEDDTREKGLTKLSFDALVRAALRGTDADNRLSRRIVQERVRAMLAGHEPAVINSYTDAALHRLSRRSVKHREREDEFSLSFDERERLKERLTELDTAESAFEAENSIPS